MEDGLQLKVANEELAREIEVLTQLHPFHRQVHRECS